MYRNIGVGFKFKRNLQLVVICTYQELGIHTIQLPELTKVSFSEIRSKGGINATSNFVKKNNLNNHMSEDDVANIDRMA